MATIKTPGRATAAQRSRIKRMVERLLVRYDNPSVTDADIKSVLRKVLVFVSTAPARYNAKTGGLGK